MLTFLLLSTLGLLTVTKLTLAMLELKGELEDE
jgi:hypothetical protein